MLIEIKDLAHTLNLIALLGCSVEQAVVIGAG